ncbi:hypothetical protein E4T49_01903 [Aureobasidium sp. EXF-10728]|nr:hypothetical protein E4T49_01903 [Aureobasidium sp. EXF-10728]
MILAEIRGLQQELEERRCSQYNPFVSLIAAKVTQERAAQTSQRPSAPTQLSNPSLDSNRQPSSDLPRCWDPCCNGRTFSNNSNLARHQREKRGSDANLKCSFCGVKFSRSSAKKVHETERRCRNVGGNAVG